MRLYQFEKDALYFFLTDMNIDIILYEQNNPFIQEVLKNAKKLDLSSL